MPLGTAILADSQRRAAAPATAVVAAVLISTVRHADRTGPALRGLTGVLRIGARVERRAVADFGTAGTGVVLREHTDETRLAVGVTRATCLTVTTDTISTLAPTAVKAASPSRALRRAGGTLAATRARRAALEQLRGSVVADRIPANRGLCRQVEELGDVGANDQPGAPLGRPAGFAARRAG